VPVTVAVLEMPPASRSACVVALVAVQETLAPGASVSTGCAGVHDSADIPGFGSAMDTVDNVTLPVFVAVKVYVTTWPTAFTVDGDGDLVRASIGAGVAVTTAGSDAETVPPVGDVPLTVPVLRIEPASMSAWVTVRLAVQETVAFGASDVTGWLGVHDNADSPGLGSVIETFDSVTLPVLRAANVYVTTCPADETAIGSAVLSSVRAGDRVAVTVAEPLADTVPPPGAVPETVAVLAMVPASMSA
jgi:hypothetical protein